MKLNIKNLGVFLNYRISNYFNDQPYELPKLSVGINYSIYKQI